MEDWTIRIVDKSKKVQFIKGKIVILGPLMNVSTSPLPVLWSKLLAFKNWLGAVG